MLACQSGVVINRSRNRGIMVEDQFTNASLLDHIWLLTSSFGACAYVRSARRIETQELESTLILSHTSFGFLSLGLTPGREVAMEQTYSKCRVLV